eukprot:TRINITY_DN17711_c0_g1_i1.p1 TRINITY_DN17711_c0_g1~~TRINITY_DN17711_c0_g1_i1.p1  ORF type:complete len:541 (-),score=123.58 TRINITY_DN17711_c0_g1_i1:277-1899(-)
MMVTLKESIDDKYGEKEDDLEDLEFIVFVSCSPEAKRGMLPPLMTLNDYNIECFGDFSDFSSKIRHIRELDLTDNLLSDWSEVVDILTSFKSLTFLNLSNNLLNEPLDNAKSQVEEKLDNAKLAMEKLVLNGNNVNWNTVVDLVKKTPKLQELHLSTNNLEDPGDASLEHENLRYLYLSCNPINDFSSVSMNLISKCKSLEFLSLAECPVDRLPEVDDLPSLPTQLRSLNVSTTKIKNWDEVEKLRKFQGLNELRIQGCPFLDEYTAHEKRMMLIARLPNVKAMNGGSPITTVEREDAERAFIRHFLDTPEDKRPARFNELIAVHGLLHPLVNIDLRPEESVKVSIYHGDECREESISVRQSVKQFKQKLQEYFNIAPINMRLWYYDQEMTKIAGPEEMKFANKELYTYNVINGDYFVVDEKAQLRVLTGSPRANSMVFGSVSPTGNTSGNTRIRRKSSESSFPQNPRTRRKSSGRTSPGRTSPRPFQSGGKSGPFTPSSPSAKTPVVRNLFGNSNVRNPVDQHYGEFFHSKVFPDANNS